MTRAWTCCLLIAMALPSVAAEPGSFRYGKEIERPAAAAESIVAAVLDSDVYAATRPALPDVRIFDAAGAEVPYLLEKAVASRTQTVRRTCPSRVASLHEQDEGLELVVQLDRDAPAADGLSIFTPLQDYERRVRVLGSRDGAAWTPLAADGLVFDYSRYMDVSNREIRLPKNDFRQLKIVVAGIADAKESPFLELTRKYRGGSEAEKIEKTVLQRRPFRMDRVELWHDERVTVAEEDKKADYPLADFRSEEDAAGQSTIVNIETRREPLTQFTIETPSRNFSRAVALQRPVTRGIRTEWVDIARGKVSLVDFGGYRDEKLAIELPEQREGAYRIVIHNEDNPPLKITGIKARGNVYRAVFLAAGGASYRLAYGAEEVQPPKYDVATVLAPLRQGHAAAEARLGVETTGPAAGTPPAMDLRAALNNPLLLGTAIIVLVAALGWALFHAAKRINKLPEE